jgi:cytochrome c-type biogenesis protein CcmH
VISRREWLAGFGAGTVTLVLRPPRAEGRKPQSQQRDTSNLFAMDQGAARSVRMAPKPGAVPSMTDDARDALEHRIRCQCGCTLDVYTCRTTDFSCQVSPAMHRDIMSLVAGGYDDTEITNAFVRVYGELALMAPTKAGFNLLGWVLPGISIGVGAVVLALVIRGLKRPAVATAGNTGGFDATPDELARIQAAVRDDE